MIDWPAILKRYAERVLFREAGRSVTYENFGGLLETERERLRRSGPGTGTLVPLGLEWDPESFAAFLAHLLEGRNVILGDGVPDGAGVAPFLKHAPLIVLRTGGTTGTPRHVVHAFASLAAPYVIQERPPVRLLVLYAADHIAGLDAFFHALHRGSTLVLPESRLPGSIAGAIQRDKVEVLPATPTFLQFLLLSGDLESRDLQSVRIIPHGAEPMPASLRERVQAAFPQARLVQRFGLTELGALPVKPDPDDPQALFLGCDAEADDPEYGWKVVDGALLIRSPTRMLGTLEGGPVRERDTWHDTGDLAEVTERGSVRILGRRESVINVGGFKVIPETVESLLLARPEVRDASVYGIPHALTGEAVAADVVFRDEPDPLGLAGKLRNDVRVANLSLAHVPTRITPVEQLGHTASGKRSRARGKA